MGFEVCYHYHDRLPDGKYNVEEKKEIKKKVGSPLDEIPLEQVAAVIMAQLARRDIWVIDVEVHEFTKKKISFKEAADGSGIVIKNKKFGVNSAGSQLVVSDVQEEQPVNANFAVKQYNHSGMLPHNEMSARVGPQKIRSWMVFEPNHQQLEEVRKERFKFTVGKKYPIYMIEPHPTMLGYQLFTTVDDAGNQKMIRDEFFVPAILNLLGDRELGFTTPVAPVSQEAKLSYQSNDKSVDMPVLR